MRARQHRAWLLASRAYKGVSPSPRHNAHGRAARQGVALLGREDKVGHDGGCGEAGVKGLAVRLRRGEEVVKGSAVDIVRMLGECSEPKWHKYGAAKTG